MGTANFCYGRLLQKSKACVVIDTYRKHSTNCVFPKAIFPLFTTFLRDWFEIRPVDKPFQFSISYIQNVL